MECEHCEKKAIKKGLCNAHYLRMWRHGSPLSGGINRGNAISFLVNNIGFSGEECLIWPFYRNSKGYGDVNFPQIEGLAHRVMCILAHGNPIDKTLEAAHTCGNGHEGCINPKHLIWKTRLENIRDKREHNTQQWGEEIHFAKLSVHQAIEIRYSKEKSSILSRKFNVTRNTVNNIRNGKTWKELP